jgi:hypothetical protein
MPGKLTNHIQEQRQNLTAVSQQFAELFAEADLSEDQIDAAIEELRPIRMWFHASKYGDAPGFRVSQGPAVDN